MDRENFDAIVARYLEKFDFTNSEGPEEWFKWNAIACFQQNWDIETANFPEMFARSVKQFSVLIDNDQAFPVGGLKTLVNQPGEAEIVRAAFRALYAEDGGDLVLRQRKAEAFVQSINDRIEKYWPGSRKYPQSIRSAILFLAMHDPGDNYILFWSRADAWARFTEFAEDFGSGAGFSLPIFYRMCDELRNEIEQNPALQLCNQKRMEAAQVSFDDQYHTLVYDMIYCAYCYHLYVDLPSYEKSTAKRIERAKERAAVEALRTEMLAARQRADAFDIAGNPPPDLIGHRVSSRFFGEGGIVSQTETRIGIQFETAQKQFIYPDVFLKKQLAFVMDSDLEAVTNSITRVNQRKAFQKAADDAAASFENAVSAFHKKWIKRVQNDIMMDDGNE